MQWQGDVLSLAPQGHANLITSLPSFGWAKNKILDLFFSPNLSFFILPFFISVGWLVDFLEPGSHSLAGWPAREARRGKFGVFGAQKQGKHSKMKQSGVACSDFSISPFVFLVGWLVDFLAAVPICFFAQPQLFDFTFFISVGWLVDFLVGARAANWESNSRALTFAAGCPPAPI